MPKRDNGNETPVFREVRYGDISKQLDTIDTVSPPTTNSLVEHDFFDLYDWCPRGLSPQMISGLLTKAISLHFSSADFITRDELKSYIWNADPVASGIRIAVGTRFDPRSANQLPAIIIKRGGMSAARVVIGDAMNLSNTDSTHGIENYFRLVTGTHSFLCMAEADGAAELLGMELFDTLSWLGPIFVDKLPFRDFQVTSISEPMIMDSLGNKVGVQVAVTYVFDYCWQTTAASSVMNTIKTTVTS